jgi:hypothetical protein
LLTLVVFTIQKSLAASKGRSYGAITLDNPSQMLVVRSERIFPGTGGHANRASRNYLATVRLFGLLSHRAIRMVATAAKEAVTHHALAQQKKQDYQDNDKKQSRYPQPRRIFSCGIRRFHRTTSVRTRPTFRKG